MMAKKHKSKKRGEGRKLWQAQPSDAIRLAALRWFGLEMERISIEIYASNQDAYADMERVMRGALAELGEIRKTSAVLDGDCPDGFVLCRDRICAPMCDGIVANRDTSDRRDSPDDE
jgi:hypothetical protein